MRKFIGIIFGCMILCSCAIAVPLSSLDRIEKQLGCTKIQEATRDIEGPLAIQGYSSGYHGEAPVSTAFWCQRTKNDFLLVFLKNGNLFHAQCRPYLHWPWYPHGLKLIKASWPTSDFLYLNDVLSTDKADIEGRTYKGKIRAGPSDVKTTGMIIQDGTSSETYFYCFKGEWMVMQRD